MSKDAGTLSKLHTLEPDTKIREATPPHTWQRSPNHSSRGTTVIDTIVIHCTAGASTQGALSRFLDPNGEASSHIIIPDDARPGEPGQTVRCVPDDRASWHVRKTVMFQGRQGMNSRSLGIEIVNTAKADDKYTDWQVAETARWCRAWIAAHPTIRFIVTHAYLDPTRRRDPCDTFPWDQFIGMVMKGGVQPQEAGPLRIFFAGKPIEADAEIHEGTTWVELRPVIQAIGYRISFDAAKNIVNIELP